MSEPVRSKEKSVEFWVAPEGSDTGSRRRTDPFGTVERARAAARERAKRPATIVLRGGVYELLQPPVFGAQDSGQRYVAYPDEQPVLSWGRPITGWRRERLNATAVWAADVGSVRFKSLHVNRGRRARPPLPKEGFFRIEEVPDLELTGAFIDHETIRALFRRSASFRAAPGDLRASAQPYGRRGYDTPLLA
jgi:hypothetical protein